MNTGLSAIGQLAAKVIRSDQIRLRSDRRQGHQIRSDQIRSDQIRSDQIRSDRIRSDQIRSDQIRSDIRHPAAHARARPLYMCMHLRICIHLHSHTSSCCACSSSPLEISSFIRTPTSQSGPTCSQALPSCVRVCTHVGGCACMCVHTRVCVCVHAYAYMRMRTCVCRGCANCMSSPRGDCETGHHENASHFSTTSTLHTDHFTGELAAWSLAEAAPAQDVFIP